MPIDAAHKLALLVQSVLLYNSVMSTTSLPSAETRCRRCCRPLRSEASKALGIGARCAAIEAANEGLSGKQALKAAELIADKGIVATNRKGVFHVVSESGEVTYTCHVNGNCTCSWGLRRNSGEAKVCYHVAAARLLAHPVIRRTVPAQVHVPVALPSSAAMWAEIDRWNTAFMAMA